jgi:hypothetical protein
MDNHTPNNPNNINSIHLLKKLSFDLIHLNKSVPFSQLFDNTNNPYILLLKNKKDEEHIDKVLKSISTSFSSSVALVLGDKDDKNKKEKEKVPSCLLCCSCSALSCSSMDKEISCLIKQHNICSSEVDKKTVELQWICEDCSKLVKGVGQLQKQIEQIQERINRAVLTLKNIVRISQSAKSKSI